MKYIRLKKQTDFQKLFQKGKRAHAPSLTIVYRPAEKMTMGISIGKKHGKSVQRNRIKRLIREAFRLQADKIMGKYLIILIPKVENEYKFDVFYKHVQWMIEKGKL